MVTLNCVIVDVAGAGSAFPVDIDEENSAGQLKDAIKEKNSTTITCDAKDLHLFLAKAVNDSWLDGAGVAAVAIDKAGVVPVPVLLDKHGKRVDHNFVEMNPLLWIKNSLHFGENFQPTEGRVHVLVVQPSRQKVGSIKKQLGYKGIGSEASCRKFLDALAQSLTNWYDFTWSYRDAPTIGDVFSAVDNNDWSFRLKKGQQLIDLPLPDYFSQDEWNELLDLNRRTNRRIHDGKVPTTSKGKPYIILPHAIFSDDRVHRYKEIATKGSVVWEPTDFVVKDEDELSGSSRSSSARSDDA